MNHPILRRPARLVAGVGICAALLGLGACAMYQPEELPANPPFAAGWQEHSRPLYNLGPGPTAGSTVWRVSGLTPRGSYQVISRQGDRAKLIEGHRFEVEGDVNKEIRLIVQSGETNLEALDERYVLSKAPTKPAK
ncbi:hypothetical protein [Ideonella sp.]|uniref:hypothetical protein n=1 Tax=Ideonella sp. TaxID=1929293 RepID=UPI002B4859A4|nr:hypothetical protein [Ideonella sp.]HJV71193.1 hypothetical protein [Ideonella sp.]